MRPGIRGHFLRPRQVPSLPSSQTEAAPVYTVLHKSPEDSFRFPDSLDHTDDIPDFPAPVSGPSEIHIFLLSGFRQWRFRNGFFLMQAEIPESGNQTAPGYEFSGSCNLFPEDTASSSRYGQSLRRQAPGTLFRKQK